MRIPSIVCIFFLWLSRSRRQVQRAQLHFWGGCEWIDSLKAWLRNQTFTPHLHRTDWRYVQSRNCRVHENCAVQLITIYIHMFTKSFGISMQGINHRRYFLVIFCESFGLIASHNNMTYFSVPSVLKSSIYSEQLCVYQSKLSVENYKRV